MLVALIKLAMQMIQVLHAFLPGEIRHMDMHFVVIPLKQVHRTVLSVKIMIALPVNIALQVTGMLHAEPQRQISIPTMSIVPMLE